MEIIAVENDKLDVEEGQEAGVYVSDKGEVVEDSRLGKQPETQKPLIDSVQDTPEEAAEDEKAAAEGETEEDREAIRERRRQERQETKRRRKERDAAKDRLITSLQRQIRDMQERVSQVDQHRVGADFARLERELRDAIQTANEAKEHLKNAAEANDGAGVADATELYYAARRKAEHLAGIKQRAIQVSQRPAAPAIDQEMQTHASKWLSKNSWFNLNGNDRDSVVARDIDNQLAAEGYDPRTAEYWEELDDRLKEHLPHKYGNGAAKPSSPKSPVGGSGRSSGTGNSGNGKFFLSADRVKAMKDAGIWDQPEARAKMIEKYRLYDKENSSKSH